jgi:hypothetical protein
MATHPTGITTPFSRSSIALKSSVLLRLQSAFLTFSKMSSNTIGIVEMLRFLDQEAHSVNELAEKSGLHPQTVRKFVGLLSSKDRRLIRIAEWHKRGTYRIWVPYYEWNPDKLPDAPKPKPLTRSQITQRYKERKLRREVMI